MHLGHTLGSTGLFGYQVWLQRRHFSVGNSSFLFMTLIYTVRYIMSRGRLVQTKKNNNPPRSTQRPADRTSVKGESGAASNNGCPLTPRGLGCGTKVPLRGGLSSSPGENARHRAGALKAIDRYRSPTQEPVADPAPSSRPSPYLDSEAKRVTVAEYKIRKYE